MQGSNASFSDVIQRVTVASDSDDLQVSIDSFGRVTVTASAGAIVTADITEELEELVAEARAHTRESRRELLGIDDEASPPGVEEHPQKSWLWNEYRRRRQAGVSEVSNRAERLSGTVQVELYGDGDVVIDVQKNAIHSPEQFLRAIGEAVTEAAAGLDDALRVFHRELDSTMVDLKKEFLR